MPITNHVTSLELSTKLEQLGVPQKSIYFWTNQPQIDAVFVHEGPGKNLGDVSAYLTSELGEFIGNALENGEDKDLPEELQPTTFQDIWNPDYLAKLLIWLLENHLISVEELGK